MKAEQRQRCSYLGMLVDPDTAINYPSKWNRCFHVRPPGTFALEYQDAYCLSPNYPICQVFQGPLGASIPADIRAAQIDPAKRKKLFFSVGLSLIALVLLGLTVWLVGASYIFYFIGGAAPTRQAAAVLIRTTTPTPLVDPPPATATFTPVLLPSTAVFLPTLERTSSPSPTIRPILFFPTSTSTKSLPTHTKTPSPTKIVIRPTNTLVRPTDPPPPPTNTSLPTHAPTETSTPFPTNTPVPPDTPVPTETDVPVTPAP